MKLAALFIVLFFSRACTGTLTLSGEYSHLDTNTIGYRIESEYKIDDTSGLILKADSTIENFKEDSDLLIEYYFEF